MEFIKMYDLEYAGKYFGIFCVIFGLLFISIPFVFSHFNVKSIYYFWFLFGGAVAFCVVLNLFFFVIKKDRIFIKKLPNRE